MNKFIISLILLLTSVAPAWSATPADLKGTAPDRYIVVPGDTLWGIAGRYLKEPWRWQELWKLNQDQIRNPNRIYPGDVLVLDRRNTQLQVQLSEVRLSPKVRIEAREKVAVPTIPPSVIEPFLSRPLVVGASELDGAARIVATEESRVAIGAGNVAYVRGISRDKGEIWQIFRRSDPLVDPDTGETLGYTAIYLGEARIRQHGEVSTVDIIKSTQEIYEGDRLLPAMDKPVFAYLPRAPQKPVSGRIVSAYGSIWEAGPLSIVALSRGSNDGLEVGHVLAIHRSASDARYALRTSPVFGRQGPSGSDAPRPYYGAELTPRDAPVYASPTSASSDRTVDNLPNERYGLVMVFRTFDRTAFGLVMQANRPVVLNDIVTNP